MAVSQFTTEGKRAALEAITAPVPFPGPISVMLMVAGHDFATDPTFVAAIAGDEITATGYMRQPLSVAGFTAQADGRVTAEFDPTAFGLLGGALDDTISGCYLFANTGNDATSPVYHCVPFVTDQTTDGTATTIQWSPVSATMRQGI
jgi:hypothetical protein